MTIDHVALADLGDRILAERHLRLSVDDEQLCRDITAITDLEPYRQRLTTWRDTATDDIDYLYRYHRVTPPTATQIIETPRGRTYTMPVFFSWLRRTGQDPFTTPAATVTPAWLDSTAENLDADRYTLLAPHWNAVDQFIAETPGVDGGFLRNHLIDREHDATRWSSIQGGGRLHYTRQFLGWARNHRELFATTPTTQEATVPFATVDQLATTDYNDRRRLLTPELMEPWRKTIIRWVNTVGESAAHMEPGWLTATVLSGPHSTLDRTINRAFDMPATLPAFAAWLRSNGQTAPDRDPADVPSGDAVRLPIDANHPDWANFWERARTAAGPTYLDYWQTLADRMGYVRTPQRERVLVQLTYQVEVEVDQGTGAPNIGVAAQERLREMVRNGTAPNRYSDGILRRNPITS